VIFSSVHVEAVKPREEDAVLDARARYSVREVDAMKDMVVVFAGYSAKGWAV
jgi:hypothetical protein